MVAGGVGVQRVRHQRRIYLLPPRQRGLVGDKDVVAVHRADSAAVLSRQPRHIVPHCRIDLVDARQERWKRLAGIAVAPRWADIFRPEYISPRQELDEDYPSLHFLQQVLSDRPQRLVDLAGFHPAPNIVCSYQNHEDGRRIRCVFRQYAAVQEPPQQVLRLITADAQHERLKGGVVRREDRRDVGELILRLAVAAAEVCRCV